MEESKCFRIVAVMVYPLAAIIIAWCFRIWMKPIQYVEKTLPCARTAQPPQQKIEHEFLVLTIGSEKVVFPDLQLRETRTV